MLQSLKDGFSAWKLHVCSECWTRQRSSLTVSLLTNLFVSGVCDQAPAVEFTSGAVDDYGSQTSFGSGVYDQAQVIETLMVCWSFRKGP